MTYEDDTLPGERPEGVPVVLPPMPTVVDDQGWTPRTAIDKRSETDEEGRYIAGRHAGALRKGARWTLKKLTTRHKQAIALLAQGHSRAVAAEATSFDPTYVSWLLRQPVAQQYIQEMNEAASVQLDAMFGQTVQVIGNAMQNGSIDQQLAAAKVQLRSTGRLDADRKQDRSAEDVVAALLNVNVTVVNQQL